MNSGRDKRGSKKPSTGKPHGGPLNRSQRPTSNKPRPSGESPWAKPAKRFERSSEQGERPAPSEAAPRKRPRAKRERSIPFPVPEWLQSTTVRSPGVSSSTVEQICENLGLTIEPERMGRLVDHLLLVREMNEEVNLVSRASVDAVLLQSLWESLVPATSTEWRKGDRVMDLGTGGGFPGLSMSIAIPEISFTLIDSRRAKTLALRRIIQETGLKNVEVVHERAETYSEHAEETFDTVTVKAVGMLKEVTPWVDGLLRPGGTLLAWKGPEGMREFAELSPDRWKLSGNLAVLPHRSIMVLEKL